MRGRFWRTFTTNHQVGRIYDGAKNRQSRMLRGVDALEESVSCPAFMLKWGKESFVAATPVCGIAAGLLCGLDLQAQTVTGVLLETNEPVLTNNAQLPLSDTNTAEGQRYLMPDLAEKLATRWEITSDWFTLKFGSSIVIDYTAFTQN